MVQESVLGVLGGYVSICAVIAVGYVIRRIGFLDAGAESTLNRVTVFVATPALYFGVLVRTDISLLLSPYALATLISLFVTAGLAVAVLQLGRARPDARAATLLVGASINPNSGNIGIPIGVAVLGSASFLAPVILLQVVLVTPAIMVLLTLRHRNASIRRTLIAAAFNPVVVAAVVGATVACFSVQLPKALLAPIDLLGDASIPLMLLAFGMSLRGARPWEQLRRETWIILVPTILKTLVLPLTAFAAGVALGVTGTELLALAIIGALPVAQNLYALAHSYGAAPDAIRSIVILSTALSLPALIAITLAWGAMN
jgi:predicted permease